MCFGLLAGLNIKSFFKQSGSVLSSSKLIMSGGRKVPEGHISSASISNTCFSHCADGAGAPTLSLYKQCCRSCLRAASPSAPGNRCTGATALMSLAVFLFIMPPVDAASAKVCIACACVSHLSMTQFPCTPSPCLLWLALGGSTPVRIAMQGAMHDTRFERYLHKMTDHALLARAASQFLPYM